MWEVPSETIILLNKVAYRLINGATQVICAGCKKNNAELVRKRGSEGFGSDGGVAAGKDLASGSGDDQCDAGGVVEGGDVGLALVSSHQNVTKLIRMVEELEEELGVQGVLFRHSNITDL